MRFRVTIAGVHRYAVRVPNQAIFNHLGEELDGLAIESRRLILISPAVQPDRREEVLGHEVEHAWSFHMPAAHTQEERAQLTATILQSLRQDLDAQGGIAALRAIQPEPISLPYRAPAVKHFAGPGATYQALDRRECGGCNAETMCGSIATGPAELHEGLGQYQVLRWFRCEICNALNCWWEISTTDGRPTGVLVQVPPPRLLRGSEAAEWLSENAVACAG